MLAPSSAQKLALLGLLIFAGCLLLEHLIESSLDPAHHQISEYANASSGEVMIAGFAAWSTSLFSTAMVVQPRLLRGLLLGASLGIALTAIFATEAVAGRIPAGETLTTTGRLHDLGSGVAGIALLMAVSINAIRDSRRLRFGSVILLSVALVASVVLLVIGDEVAGLRQRVLVCCALLWQLLAIRDAAQVD